MSVTFISDVGVAELIEQSQINFDNAALIISKSLTVDLIAINEIEVFLNQKSVFLEASQDFLHWERDTRHDQTQFHFVLLGKREDKRDWLASDARYARIRLTAMVKNLADQLESLKLGT